MVDTLVRNQGRRTMRIHRDQCTGLVVDIQERLFPVMDGKEKLLRKCIMLLEGLKALEIPILVTEQYPKGLGHTISPILQVLDSNEAIEKISFSCCDETRFIKSLENLNKKAVIICGIEAHVCVFQTVIDMIEAGYLPVVVSDCISSRQSRDKDVALDRMRLEGAVITTAESILFELTGRAGTDLFKTISRLVK
jgi:hypothetical protein